MQSGKSKLLERYVRHTVNHETHTVRKGVSKPVMCHRCKLFFQRIDTHLFNFHQMKRYSGEYNKALRKYGKVTKIFLRSFSLLKLGNDHADINILTEPDSPHVSSLLKI